MKKNIRICVGERVMLKTNDHFSNYPLKGSFQGNSHGLISLFYSIQKRDLNLCRERGLLKLN